MITRRDFLRTTTIAGATVALGGVGRIFPAFSQTPTLPAPEASGIEHVNVDHRAPPPAVSPILDLSKRHALAREPG